MKKLLFSSAIFAFVLSLNAQNQFLKVETGSYNAVNTFPTIQNSEAKALSISTGDTLRYFLNKHYYRNTNAGSPAPNTQYYTLLNPYSSSSYTINYCGGVFLNTSSITVTGLEGIVTRRANAVSSSIPVKLYLCNVNGANLPIFPPLDSVSAIASSTNSGAWIGGNFNTPIPINGKFAVLFNNASNISGDTLGMFINNACTPTSTCPAAQKYGESLGVMRINGNFQSSTNTFGTGTDYEFIVAPRILFTYSSSAIATTPTICTNALGSFSNTSTPMNLIENRQFNFNKFASVWGALSNTLLPITDSIYNWTFTGSPTGSLTTKHAAALFNVTGIQTASLKVKYNKSRASGLLTSVFDVATATINASAANAPTLSIYGSSIICVGSSATLTASGNPTYTWTNPPSNNVVVVVTPSVTTTYTVTGVNGACVGYQTFMVNVVSNPSVIISGPSSACIGNNSLVLTAIGASSFAWSNGSTNYSIAVSGSLAGVQSFTCVGQIDACPPATAIKNVTINALPSVSLTAPVSTLCTKATGGQTVVLSGTPVGGLFSGQYVSSGVFTPSVAASYTQSYLFTNTSTGCSNTATTSILVLKCNAIGLNEIALNQNMVLYPNPTANGWIELKNLEGNNSIAIYNSLGELIFKELCNKGDLKIDLSEKAAGSYILKITDMYGSNKMLKVIIQN